MRLRAESLGRLGMAGAVAALTLGAGVARSLGSGSRDDRPSFVLVIADDLDVASVEQLPGLLDRIASQGVTFSNAFASQPLCCPSRVSMLRGQYTHNHTIVANFNLDGSCYEAARDRGLERSTVATWLQSAGYRTAMVGKYLNRYPGTRSDRNPRAVPEGWDAWYSPLWEGHSKYFNYDMNENGEIVHYGRDDDDYFTNVLTAKAVDFIRRAPDGPIFVQVGSLAPHDPAFAPTRHLGAFVGWTAPRTPSFNEVDVSDKPRWIRENLPLMTEGEISELDETYRGRLRTMLAVEELIEAIDDALRDTGRLDNTYVIFVSDHGVHQGHHRFRRGKSTLYEPSIRIPMMVRGPGVAVGETREHMVLNVDLPGTIAELAGVQAPDFVDGRSLVGLLRDGNVAPEAWREAVLLERPGTPGDTEGIPGWWGLRTLDATFGQYATGEVEYYDLRTDPDQLENLAGRVDPSLLEALSSRLARGLSCIGASCD